MQPVRPRPDHNGKNLPLDKLDHARDATQSPPRTRRPFQTLRICERELFDEEVPTVVRARLRNRLVLVAVEHGSRHGRTSPEATTRIPVLAP